MQYIGSNGIDKPGIFPQGKPPRKLVKVED